MTPDLPPPVAVPHAAHPVAAVVVPVHGQLAFTARCLTAVVANTAAGTYQLVVVDDASPDRTAAWLGGCTGVTVVSQPVNQGYLRSTRAGVAASDPQAEFVVLLNNDTEVGAGWLDELMAAARADPAIGSVGGLLVFPDGRLQEAGSIVWSDGTVKMFGRLGDPDDANVQFLRDVHYSSGACLLVRRSAWDAVGGYDEGYAPAYYEDCDLAFRLRRAGWRTVFTPFARVTHHARVSHREEAKELMATNRARLTATWAPVLATHPPPGSVPRAAAHADPRDRVLIVTDHLAPDPLTGTNRALELAAGVLAAAPALAVTIIPRSGGRAAAEATAELRRRGVEVHWGREPLATVEARADATVAAVVTGSAAASTWLEHLRVCLPGATLVLDVVPPLVPGAVVPAVDADLLMVSDEALAAGEPVVVVPLCYRAARPSLYRPVEPARLVASGNPADPADRDAVRRLARDVMPLVWARRPDAILTVAGQALLEHQAADRDRVTRAGFDELGSVLASATLAVAAHRWQPAGGILAVAAAGFGVLTVATSASRTPEAVPHRLCDDSPAAIADAVVDALGAAAEGAAAVASFARSPRYPAAPVDAAALVAAMAGRR